MIKILEYTTEVPLKMIGHLSGICWGADTTNYEKNVKRAWDCINSFHGRTEEFPEIYCTIDGYSAKCLRELYTHIGGSPTRLQASTRYIDYEKGFKTVLPPKVESSKEATASWNAAVDAVRDAMADLKNFGVPKEDYTNLLPLAYESNMVWKLNSRTLITFMNKRLCGRAYWEIRKLANELKTNLREYSEEWKAFADAVYVPECEKYKFLNPNLCFCCETRGCGKYPYIKNIEVSVKKDETGNV